MTTGRTLVHYARVYIDGRDMSGYSRNFGPLATTFDEGIDDVLNVNVKGVLPGNGTVSMGSLNGLFDNTATTGIHAVLGTPGAQRTVMIAQGIRGVPAAGDPVFAGQFIQNGYYAGGSDNPVTASIPFSPASAKSSNMNYVNPWGMLLHANSAETGVNAGNGLGGGGATTKGGFMCYHVLAAAGTGNITCTFKVQDGATAGAATSDLLSTGVINCGSGGAYVPIFGIVALAPTATVASFTRWQIVLGTATSVTFVLSFHRNYI